jgi:hypothetical protein
VTDDEWKIMYVPLRDHIDQRLTDLEKAIEEARRLMTEKMNGFPNEYVRKGDMGENMAALNIKVEQLTEWRARMQGVASQNDLASVRWIALGSLIVSMLGHLFNILFKK